MKFPPAFDSLLPLHEALQDEQVGLTQATFKLLTWVLECVGCCMCCARCPNPRAGREKASKTMQLAKRGSLLLTRARALCSILQWCRSESPEPKLLHKFIG